MSAWRVRVAGLFSAHRARLQSMVSRRVRDREHAADLVQDAFVRLLAAGSSGSVEADTRMLYAIARNATIDHDRTVRRRAEAMASVVPEQVLRAVPSAEAALEAREIFDLLKTTLRKLPQRTQDAFILRRVYGLSHAEIADILRIAPSTVEKHLARAIGRCEERLRRFRES